MIKSNKWNFLVYITVVFWVVTLYIPLGVCHRFSVNFREYSVMCINILVFIYPSTRQSNKKSSLSHLCQISLFNLRYSYAILEAWMFVCVCLCVCVVLRIGRGLATGWSLVQGVLPSVNKITKLNKRWGPNKRVVEPLKKKKNSFAICFDSQGAIIRRYNI
jgi:hypothetical protein